MQIDDLWAETGHGRIFARRWQPRLARPGSPAPIVLMHESLGCVDYWRDFPAELARLTGRAVIAYDRLGFGQSDPHPGHLTPVTFIADEARVGFRALKKALGMGQFVAYGHSVGGTMAVCCALEYPDDCVGVVCEATVVKIEPRTAAGLVEARRVFADQMQFQRLIKYHGDKSRWVLDAWLETWGAEEMKNWSLESSLRQVHCPVLSIQGAHDEFSTDEQPNFIATHVGGPVVLRLIDECGHVPHREKQAEVLSACSDWLHGQEIA